MGSFGRLLIKSWGGNLQSYDGDSSISVAFVEAVNDKPRCIYSDNGTVRMLKDKVIYGFVKASEINKEKFLSHPSLNKRDWRRFQLWCHKYNKI